MRGWMLIPEFDGIGQSFTPGKCVMCGTSASDRRKLCSGVWITNKIETNRYGKVQFCGECVKAAARLLGMEDSDAVARLEAAAAAHNDAVKHLAKVHARLEAALKSVEAVAK